MVDSSKGKPISSEIKKSVVKVKNYFDIHKDTFGSIDSSAQMTAEALELGVASVRRILADFKKDPQSLDKPPQLRGRPTHAIDATHEEIVRSYVRTANIQGHYITLETMQKYLEEISPGIEFHPATLARSLDRWGFTFGRGTRSQHLKEKEHVVAARQRYLRRKKLNRDGDKTLQPEVYLDESYVNKNHSNDLIWYFDEDGPWVQKPTRKGERLIILNAITADGWIPGAKCVFKSSRKTGDYHGQMNGDLFQKWFVEALLPNIPKKSLIVMDNAAYHNVLARCSAPIHTSKKADIYAWLHANKVPCSTDALKAELVELIKKIAPEPTYALDEIAKEHGHEILRTPPYHPELQPIEICWGIVKNHVARNSNFTMTNLLSQLEVAFTKVTAASCVKIIEKIRKNEDDFWNGDAMLDRAE